jgi:hypothetical protein
MKKLALLLPLLACAGARPKPPPAAAPERPELAAPVEAPPPTVPGLVRNCWGLQLVNLTSTTLASVAGFVSGAGGLATLNPAPGSAPPRALAVGALVAGGVAIGSSTVASYTTALLQQCAADAAGR